MSKPLNIKTLAEEVCIVEGKKINLSIAQVSEVVSVTLCLLDAHIRTEGTDGAASVLATLAQASKNRSKRKK